MDIYWYFLLISGLFLIKHPWKVIIQLFIKKEHFYMASYVQWMYYDCSILVVNFIEN